MALHHLAVHLLLTVSHALHVGRIGLGRRRPGLEGLLKIGMPGGIPSASTGPALTARKPRAASEAIIAVFLRKYPFLQVWVSRSIEHMPGRLSPLPELAREMVSPSALLYT